jgi:hypothetical protein
LLLHQAPALLRFIAAHTPESHRFDVDVVQKKLEASAAATDAALHAATSARLASDPVFPIYAQSPCGPLMMDWMRLTLVSRYLTRPVPESEQQAAFTLFQKCMQTKDQDMRKYWEQLAVVAADNLDKYKEKQAPVTDEKEVTWG